METDRIKRVSRLSCVNRKGYCCRYPPRTITSPFILITRGVLGWVSTHSLPLGQLRFSCFSLADRSSNWPIQVTRKKQTGLNMGNHQLLEHCETGCARPAPRLVGLLRICAQCSLSIILPRRVFASARSLAIFVKRVHRDAICASWAICASRAACSERTLLRSSSLMCPRRPTSAR